MTFKAFTKSAMDSFETLVDKFSELVALDTGGNTLAADDATAVIAVMAGTVAVLLEGKVKPGVIQKVFEALKPFQHRHVSGASFGREYGIDVPDSAIDLTPKVRKARNEINDQRRHYSEYMTCINIALMETGKRPAIEQTIANLRAAFLRSIDYNNIISKDQLNLQTDFDFDLS